MRLLNTTTFKVEEFTGSDIPKYAILSHRWGSEEITFQDIQNSKNFRNYIQTQPRVQSEGWFKIKGCSQQAVTDGYQYIWVDSCCIDKTSSAELSEAINSMFNWYRDSGVCYAYLSDLRSLRYDGNTQFENSKWFSRGWTLQELLAPKKLVFFTQDWKRLGTRDNMWHMVSKVTGIKNETGWEMASVAQKFSWASKRETMRIEDRAYSLMGLFGVNMPPLYGEGEKAFIRLQLEILRTSDDESIFSWKDENNISGGLLARSPTAFQSSGDIVRVENLPYEKPPYSMTNKGLRMEVPLLPAWHQQLSPLDADDTYLAPIQCRFNNNTSMIAILLRCIKGSQFRRIASGELVPTAGLDLFTLARVEQDPNIRKTIQVKQEDDFELSFRGFYQYKFSLASNVLELRGFDVTDRYISRSNMEGIAWTTKPEEMLLIDRVLGGDSITVALEFTQKADDEYNPGVGYSERERFIVVFNIFATRARLGIIIPHSYQAMQTLLRRHVRPGDWMTNAAQYTNFFSSKTRVRGSKITAQLIRNQIDLGLRSYEAEISFEGAIELPNNEILFLPWQGMIPGIVELPNNEVKSFGRRKLKNSMSGDPEPNYYMHSFLIFRDLEKDREMGLRGNIFYDVDGLVEEESSRKIDPING
jgi:hypothetical protein